MANKTETYLNQIADPVEQRALSELRKRNINISRKSSNAINVSVVQDDETGLDETAVFKHGTYSTALAYGSQTDHMVFKSMHVTAAATAAKWVFGDVNYIETSADSIGYIDVGYNYLSVGHNLVNGFASRGRVAVTAACTLGEHCGVLGTMEIGAYAIDKTGSATLSAGIFDTEVTAGATVKQEVTCLEIRPRIRANIEGSSCGIRINIHCSSTNYVNYGLDIRSMSAQQTAAIRILATPTSDALPCGLHIEGQSSSTSTVTNAISLAGIVTNVLDFASTDGTNGAARGTWSSCGTTTQPDGYIKVDVGGNTMYAYLWNTVVAFS